MDKQINPKSFKNIVRRICPFCGKHFDTICRNTIYFDGMPTGLNISGFEHIASKQCVEHSLETGAYIDNIDLTRKLMSALCERLRVKIRVNNTLKFADEIAKQFESKRFLWAIRFFGNREDIIDILHAIHNIHLPFDMMTFDEDNLERILFAFGFLSTLDFNDEEYINEEAYMWVQMNLEHLHTPSMDYWGENSMVQQDILWEIEQEPVIEKPKKKKLKLIVIEDVVNERDFALSLGEKAKKQCQEKLKKLKIVD
jgi:hypothetical protein